ncbi:Small conductance calcium-activated potassium channel protein [Fasciola gigantica]|uniref:Small conductance calcium-activated potassium channel protein n=1 Tax=Fasciola gigantica TaxID=46835 RepID=A0A504YUH0_FASGI|nr:Small conductance calcium-activated potassium channel protein [Fasciola gigantica]
MNNQHQQRTIRNVGYRLGRRKRLFEKRCRISDFALTFALFGIFVMLVETELTFAGIYRKELKKAQFIRASCDNEQHLENLTLFISQGGSQCEMQNEIPNTVFSYLPPPSRVSPEPVLSVSETGFNLLLFCQITSLHLHATTSGSDFDLPRVCYQSKSFGCFAVLPEELMTVVHLLHFLVFPILFQIIFSPTHFAKIFSSDDSIEDWRMAVDCNRIGQMALELIVCLIHPFPGSDAIQFPISPSYVGPVTDFHPYTFPVPVRPVELDPGPLIRFNRSTVITKSNSRSPLGHVPTGPSTHNSGFNITSGSALYPYKIVSIDLILSVPMFLRLYLLFRAMLLHSKLFTDAGSRSIGAMNKVNFDMRFIFKTLMTMCPGKLLLGFILCLWIIYSWSLRACESFFEKEQGNLLNSMWLIAVTFLSIGYGDIVPHTYCGRAIALATGVMGSACTALIVAVFARKLELSKAEKHVIHFMMENQLNKKVKNYAANVLRETWLIYKYTKLAKRVDASKVRAHQRKFLRAIHG